MVQGVRKHNLKMRAPYVLPLPDRDSASDRPTWVPPRRLKGGPSICGIVDYAQERAKLDNWAIDHGLPPEPFAFMKQAVIALFADMERNGELN